MKIITYSFFYILTIFAVLIFNSCGNKNDTQPINQAQSNCFNNLYRLKNVPLTSISTDWSVNLNVNHLNENLSIMCEFSYSTNEFRIVDLSKDELIKIIKFPEVLNKVGSISLIDANSFAFLTDTTFYLFKDNQFNRIDYGVFKDGYIPLNYINMLYKPKENKLIAGVLSYTKRKVDEADYSSYFLNVYDLNKMKSSLIPFSYPKQFHGNKLGIPKVYLSEWENDLIVSFELDDNIYKIDMQTFKIDTIPCKSAISNVNDAFFPKEGDKQSKVDAIQKNSLNVGGYGMAFYNKKNNKVYRLYRPGLPVKDNDGNYFNSTDKGTHVLELDLSDNNMKEVQLANGQYYVPMHWSFNRFNNSLIYPKLEEHVTKKNNCFYNIHSISIFNH